MYRCGIGRLRRLGVFAGLTVVAALAVVSATSASVDVGNSGSSVVVRTSGEGKVFVCKYVGTPGVDERLQTGDNPISVSVNAIPAGASIGAYFADKQGRSFVLAFDTGQDEPDVSECPQPEVPPTDVCPNIEGNQTDIPDGMVKDEHGNCVTPTPPTDACPNIEGNQTHIPDGMVKDEHGNCVTPTPPTDACPNIEGNQASVPNGLVKDEHGNCVTPTSPPPPTVKSDEFMDVRVIKEATPQVGLVNGQAEITYTVLVRNDGPNQAHNVVVTDAAPGGVTFLTVTQPVNGFCTVTPTLLSCTLGTLGPGVERSIVLTARVTQAGTYVNSATATGDGKDTNGANNTDDASTLVTAPATPPTAAPTPKPKPKPVAKPKPAPQVPMCRVLKVTPGMVKANGNRQLVIARVTQSRNPVKGVAVRFTGKGLSKVVVTNAQGVARFSIAPRKAGIMLVKITSAKACNSARIGVIGAFEPPVTG
jgi:uncharacterized repeat protein (TIGR01451 family)